MKKLILIAIILGMLFGCTGLKSNVAVNVATDTAFVMVLQNNPTYKPVIAKALQDVKMFLKGTVTYDDLMLFLAKQFDGKYAYVCVIITGYIDTDKPIFETYLPMLESYKIDIIKKIDRLILLSSL